MVYQKNTSNFSQAILMNEAEIQWGDRHVYAI